MYEAKARYYQNKEETCVLRDEEKNYIQVNTGIKEIDKMISLMKDHYNGIYKVSIDSDKAYRILMPSYLGYNEEEEHFSDLMAKYIDSFVHPDFRRAVLGFLNYDAIKKQLSDGKIPSITYKKVNDEDVILSIYPLGDGSFKDTLWVFAKD